MPSKLSEQIADSVVAGMKYYGPAADIPAEIDPFLDPVRTVLESLRYGGCWCESLDVQPHDRNCLAAQELVQSLNKDTSGQ